MTNISLSAFQQIAQDSVVLDQLNQKLSVASGDVHKREANTSIGGRLVSWVKLHTTGDTQKTEDQNALKTALRETYTPRLGELAYAHACRACGINDGKTHSLTAKQVLSAINFAEKKIDNNPALAFSVKAERNYSVSNEALASKKAQVQERFEQPLKVKLDMPETSLDQHAQLIWKPIEGTDLSELRDTILSGNLFDDLSSKYGSKIADKVISQVKENGIFEMLVSDYQKDPSVKHPAGLAEDKLISIVNEEAREVFIESLPEATQSVLDDVTQVIDNAHPKELADAFNVKDIPWDVLHGGDMKDFKEVSFDMIIDELRAHTHDENYLSQVARDDFNDILIENLEDMKLRAVHLGTPDAAKEKSIEPKELHWA